ncbi:hypothetical protein F4861DRAFT_128148 [Xylaria intraflava]|nr:hypothetical protein F4861DRAFT_128148 [Xylaria intraflava]
MARAHCPMTCLGVAWERPGSGLGGPGQPPSCSIGSPTKLKVVASWMYPPCTCCTAREIPSEGISRTALPLAPSPRSNSTAPSSFRLVYYIPIPYSDRPSAVPLSRLNHNLLPPCSPSPTELYQPNQTKPSHPIPSIPPIRPHSALPRVHLTYQPQRFRLRRVFFLSLSCFVATICFPLTCDPARSLASAPLSRT